MGKYTKRTIKKTVVVCWCLVSGFFAANCFAQELTKGQVIDHVACLSDSSQSYALYLPSSYSTDKKWPILYGFDPGGRGNQPVELYREAAEKYGWIVVGSNNSRNGPGIPLNTILQVLWNDTQARFAIDERRVYATGMSGGARVASSFAIALNERMAGVIACAAGFPSSKAPSKETRFAFLGIAGIEDFNFSELYQLDEAFEKLKLPHQLLTFEGGHGWPPKPILNEAVEWMELQAINSGLRVKDEKLIDDLYAQWSQHAREAEAAGKRYEVTLRYRMIAECFKGLRNIDEVSSYYQKLKDSKETKDATNQIRNQQKQQELRSRDLAMIFQALNSDENKNQAILDARNLIARLRRDADGQNSSSDRIVAKRVLDQFFVSASEEATRELFSKRFDKAAEYLSIASQIRPTNPQIFYRLAAAYAQSGMKKQAFEALRKALANGFSDLSRLDQAPEFESLRQEKEFIEILSQLKNK